MLHSVVSDLGLQCLPMSLEGDARHTRVNINGSRQATFGGKERVCSKKGSFDEQTFSCQNGLH